MNLRESGALGPNAAVMADDGRGGQVIAFDFAHEMLIYVGLPRHLLLFFSSGICLGFSVSCCLKGSFMFSLLLCGLLVKASSVETTEIYSYNIPFLFTNLPPFPELILQLHVADCAVWGPRKRHAGVFFFFFFILPAQSD